MDDTRETHLPDAPGNPRTRADDRVGLQAMAGGSGNQ